MGSLSRYILGSPSRCIILLHSLIHWDLYPDCIFEISIPFHNLGSSSCCILTTFIGIFILTAFMRTLSHFIIWDPHPTTYSLHSWNLYPDAFWNPHPVAWFRVFTLFLNNFIPWDLHLVAYSLHTLGSSSHCILGTFIPLSILRSRLVHSPEAGDFL